jgi:hypothetical protein
VDAFTCSRHATVSSCLNPFPHGGDLDRPVSAADCGFPSALRYESYTILDKVPGRTLGPWYPARAAPLMMPSKSFELCSASANYE